MRLSPEGCKLFGGGPLSGRAPLSRLAHRLKLSDGLASRVLVALAGAGCLSVLLSLLGAIS
jgi:hypothetical protein